jgi:hypothetical protein
MDWGVFVNIGGLPPGYGLEHILCCISRLFAGDAIDPIPEFTHQSYLNYRLQIEIFIIFVSVDL